MGRGEDGMLVGGSGERGKDWTGIKKLGNCWWENGGRMGCDGLGGREGRAVLTLYIHSPVSSHSLSRHRKA